MRRIKVGSLRMLSAGALLLLWGATAEAAWVSEASGHTVFDFGGGVADADGVVSFAVWDVSAGTTGNWLTDLGLTGAANPLSLSAAVDTDASLVFFYQIVNVDNGDGNNIGDDALSALQINFKTGVKESISSYGRVDDYVFADGGNPVKFGGDLGLGDVDESSGDTPHDSTPSEKNATPSGLVSDTDAIGATAATLQDGELVFKFEDAAGADILTTFSSLMFFTLERGSFAYSPASSLQDGASSSADIVTPTPVPATLAMLLGGLPGFAGLGLVLRRKRETVAA